MPSKWLTHGSIFSVHSSCQRRVRKKCGPGPAVADLPRGFCYEEAKSLASAPERSNVGELGPTGQS